MPTICIVEDAHWADEATIDVLTFVARRVEATSSLLLVSFRDDEIGPDHPLRRALAAAPADRTYRLELERLSVEAIASPGGSEVDAEALRAITGGNPFFVREALASGPGRTPASVRDAVLARAARLSDGARAVAELVSVHPVRVPLSLLEECASVRRRRAGRSRARRPARARPRPGRLPSRARAVGDRGIAGRAPAPGPQPCGAAVLERRDAAPARLAHHAWAAGDADAIVRHGLAAAHAAVAAHSHREAQTLLIRVLEHGHLLAPRERAAALELLSEEAYYGNEPARAVSARQQALVLRRELGEPLLTGASLRWLSRIQWLAGDGAAAERAAAEAVEELEPFPESHELALALSNRSQLDMLAQRDDDALRWGRRAMALARRLGDTETLVHAQTNVGTALVRSDLDAGLDLLDEAATLAITAGYDEHAGRAMLNAAWMLKDARRYASAREVLERGLAFARDREIDLYAEYLVATRALIDLATGDWDAAVAAAQGLVDAAPAGQRGRTHPGARGRRARRRCAAGSRTRASISTRRGSWPARRASCSGCGRSRVPARRRRGCTATRTRSTPRRATCSPSPMRSGTSGTSVSWCCGGSAAG